jgi:hypothetical protein
VRTGLSASAEEPLSTGGDFTLTPPISVDFGDRVCCFLPLRFFVSLKAATPLSA